MASPPDQGSGTGATPEAAAAELRRQASCASCGPEEAPVAARQDRSRLSASASFCSSSPGASPARSTSSSATHYLPASNKLSSESIPFSVHDLSSFSSSSSYESFFHIDASDLAGAASAAEFLDFEPTTRAPPAVQTMMMAAQQQGAAGYDAKRLPSSMFRARSTAMPGDWSVTSNDSLFSIQLSHSGDLSAMYADMYYDAAGFPHFSPSGGAGDLKKLASMSSDSSSVRSGGLCVRHDCARCGGSSGGKTRKSVRFAATESVVSTEGKHSVVVSTLEVAMEEENENARESATKAPEAGWCELGCCLPSPTTAWWPRCCVCCGCGCRCKWWI
ncbi:unnamed protein product [Urochloa decumbens]|uniref:Uncharacterized protein n=1 Tax=Urochloa decumbens TaxID=240449 RepID=A0ABC8W4U6_9POAL